MKFLKIFNRSWMSNLLMLISSARSSSTRCDTSTNRGRKWHLQSLRTPSKSSGFRTLILRRYPVTYPVPFLQPKVNDIFSKWSGHFSWFTCSVESRRQHSVERGHHSGRSSCCTKVTSGHVGQESAQTVDGFDCQHDPLVAATEKSQRSKLQS